MPAVAGLGNCVSNGPFILVIADYGKGDPAFGEVYQRIINLIPDANIKDVSVEPLSTTQTGFWAYQFALNQDEIMEHCVGGKSLRPTYIFMNTAPRKDNKGPRKDNEGERLVLAELTNGVKVVGALSGESFSFIKPMIKKLSSIEVPATGSQFRSRDAFPNALKDVVLGAAHFQKELKIDSIPQLKKGYRIAHVDGFGNVKLTVRKSQCEFRIGDTVTVSVEHRSLRMRYAEGIFSINEGELSLAPGSSGPKDDRFLEISKRAGNAWEELGRPRVESELSVSKSGK